jgi:hypothetical protein
MSLAIAGFAASCAPSDEETRATTAVAPLHGASPGAAKRTASIRSRGPVSTTIAEWQSEITKSSTPAADKVKLLASAIAADLAARCPFVDAADKTALDTCKKAMHSGSKMRQALSPITLWGRQNKDPQKALADTNLTQFGPDVLTGMYMPLFMFSGKHQVSYDAREKLYRVELGVRFRNRLPPGQFPYPFWHEDEKWNAYENANAMLLWVDPKSLAIKTAQFSARGTLEPQATPNSVVQAKFDGRWMWTDKDGVQQPKVTLFDGLFRSDNPHLKTLDSRYRELALSLRDGQCMSCHTPNNDYKMKRLVLLQTPAHAAAEIKRVMATVKRGSMPLDPSTGIETALVESTKSALLTRAAAFEKAVDAAKAWEAAAAKSATSPAAPSQPAATPAPKRTANAEE